MSSQEAVDRLRLFTNCCRKGSLSAPLTRSLPAKSAFSAWWGERRRMEEQDIL